jgi:dihydrofolate reductase
VLTEIHGTYDGDTRFPVPDDDEWIEADRDSRDEFDFVTYERVDG